MTCLIDCHIMDTMMADVRCLVQIRRSSPNSKKRGRPLSQPFQPCRLRPDKDAEVDHFAVKFIWRSLLNVAECDRQKRKR